MNRFQKIAKYYIWGGRFLTDPYHIATKKINETEFLKKPFRFDIINYLLANRNCETSYLEIGVRNPADNFEKILANKKFSVDPGLEYKENPVDFKMTSNTFFNQLERGLILENENKFDIIYIDGLHLANQVDTDIQNGLNWIKEDGFLVLHDCNPPTEWHARETHEYVISPAGEQWNGSTWKAFLKARNREDLFSCCIDSDWGVGIISKNAKIGTKPISSNPFYEFGVLDKHRKDQLGLIDFHSFQKLIENGFH